jgi:hypothetical protein
MVIKRRPLGGWWPAVLDSGFDPDTEAFAAGRDRGAAAREAGCGLKIGSGRGAFATGVQQSGRRPTKERQQEGDKKVNPRWTKNV